MRIFDLKQGFITNRPTSEIALTTDGAPARGFFDLSAVGGVVLAGQTVTVAGVARNVTGSATVLLNNGAGSTIINANGAFSQDIVASVDASSLAIMSFNGSHVEFTSLTIDVN